ncbi:MAG: hypothetical protein ABI693_20580, partial [Bryobacteraceae bacterium]
VESLNGLSCEHVSKLFGAWYMNTAADPMPVDPEEEPETADLDAKEPSAGAEDRIELTPALQLHGLHAKLFVSDDGWNAHVWTGSANATVAAFERNVEFMVHLTGKKAGCGVASFVNLTADASAESVDADTNGQNDRKLGFSDLLVKYDGEARQVIDDTRRALEHKLETVRYALAGAKIAAQVEPLIESVPTEGATTRFRVTLTRPSQDLIELPPEVDIECHPLTLKANTALSVGTPVGLSVVVFEPLSFEALTSFYAFRLTASKDELELSCGFVLNLPLIGAPADRKGRLLLTLLRNREQLLKYLLMLLSDDEESARRLVEAFDGDAGNYHADSHEGGFGLPLLEPLLQALDRQPTRLDQIARLIDDLRRTPEGRQLVSEQFLSIWEPIWTARKRIANA